MYCSQQCDLWQCGCQWKGICFNANKTGGDKARKTIEVIKPEGYKGPRGHEWKLTRTGLAIVLITVGACTGFIVNLLLHTQDLTLSKMEKCPLWSKTNPVHLNWSIKQECCAVGPMGQFPLLHCADSTTWSLSVTVEGLKVGETRHGSTLVWIKPGYCGGK